MNENGGIPPILSKTFHYLKFIASQQAKQPFKERGMDENFQIIKLIIERQRLPPYVS